MATSASAASARIVVEQPFVGFFGDRDEIESPATAQMCVVADADLLNLGELQATVAPSSSAIGLIPALYRREGPAFLRRLEGAFALGLWDFQERTLLLATDRFGMRRLHYTIDPHRIAFATRPSILLAPGPSEARLDPTSVYTYLNFGYVPAPASVFRDIERLEPGQYVVARAGRRTVARYWDVSYTERPIAQARAAHTVSQKTEDAVQTALHDIKPEHAGTFLSGGTDSSVVLGLASRVTGARFNAFSIGFAEGTYNELGYAELAVRHFRGIHHAHIVRPSEALALLPELIEAYDEPFGNNSALGTLAAARLARERGVDVLLAGDGGDEIFGGNERYRVDRIFARYQRVPLPLRRWLLEPMLSRLPASAGIIGRAQRYIRRANIPNPERFYSYEFFFSREGHELLDPDFRLAVERDAPIAVLARLYARPGAVAELNRLLYLDLKLTIGDNDLLKVTRTAELAGLRVRFPLLDAALVEFMATLPARYKVRGLEKRYLFKQAFRDLLPPAILTKRKHGFGVPTSLWLKTDSSFRDMARDTLLSSRSLERGYFRRGAVERLFELHATDATPYYGDILWTALMLELWHRRHADRLRAA